MSEVDTLLTVGRFQKNDKIAFGNIAPIKLDCSNFRKFSRSLA